VAGERGKLAVEALGRLEEHGVADAVVPGGLGGRAGRQDVLGRSARRTPWRPGSAQGPLLRVLELARGYTNREIADTLVISVRTAGVHVSHILRKLGAPNRLEAAAIAHRLSPPPARIMPEGRTG
jgi:Bacterial regulatory proteins, luxR family